MEKVAAGIVSFNPKIDRLKDNINAVLNQVDHIYIFDNASMNSGDLQNLVSANGKVSLYLCPKNKGLSYALNGLMKMAIKAGYEWMILMDQDSVLQEDTVKQFSKYIGRQDVAIICPYVIDSRRKYMKYEYDNEIEEVGMCITSGSMTRISIWKELGGFDDFLFIDLIDNDYCKNVILHKYKILRVNTVLMNQEFGKIIPRSEKVSKFFVRLGEVLHNTNIQKFSYKKFVDPRRVYYTSRNVLYLNKKYENYGGIGYENYHCSTFAGFLLCFCFASVVRAQKKGEAAKMCMKGLREGKAKAQVTHPVKIG